MRYVWPSPTAGTGRVGPRHSRVAAAAGNDGADNDVDGHWPSNYGMDNVISVAATDMADDLASFSNIGSCLTLFAPGNDIVSASYRGDTSETSLSGTSMAAPHVRCYA